MAAGEIRTGGGVDHAAGAGPELVLDQRPGIGTGDRVHGVEPHPETRPEQGSDRVEVEQRAHQAGVVGNRIEHLDVHVREPRVAIGRKIDVGSVENAVGGDPEAAAMDRRGDGFGGRPSVRDVDLQAEVAVPAAGIVACGEHKAAVGAPPPDLGRGGRGREQPVPPHRDTGHAVGRRHLEDHLGRAVVEEPPVAPDDQRRAGIPPDDVEDRLHHVLEPPGLHGDTGACAQPGGAGPLIRYRRGGNGPHSRRRARRHHDTLPASAAALAALSLMPVQSPALMRAGGATQLPPTQVTLASRR